MSTIAKCQKCGQQVAIPSGMPFDSIVRCPFCKAEFPLRVFLAGDVASPPELEAVGPAPAPSPQPMVETQVAQAPAADPVGQVEAVVAPPPSPAAAAGEEIVAEVVPEPAGGPSGPAPDAAPGVFQQVAAQDPKPEAVTQAIAAEPLPPIGASQTIADESPYVGGDVQEGGPPSGAPMAGELMDLWQEAGVAPPIDAPDTGAATRPATTDPAPMPAAYEYTGTPTDGGGRPLGPTQSFAAQARKAEQPISRTIVRIVGMMVAGLLAVLITWGGFKLAGCGRRGNSPPPKSQPAAKPTPGSPAPIVPDKRDEEKWKGLKPLGGK
jgi:hypothetical protein